MTANATHDEILGLIPAYALASLDAAEAERVGRHLAGCEICQTELATYESVVGLMALGAPDALPAPDLKDRLLTHANPRSAQSPKVASQQPLSSSRNLGQKISEAVRDFLTGSRWRPVTVALVVILLISNVLLWQQSRSSQTTDGWQQIHLYGSDVAPAATGIIYISADGRNGTLVVDGLPTLTADQQYQLWLIKDEQRNSGAVFSVDQDGYRGIEIESAVPLDTYSAFGVTIEPAGGSPGPTGERVLGYNLQS